MTDAFPSDKGKVIGVANSMNGIGWAVGPPVGGLTELFIQTAAKFSNGRKIARIVPIWTKI